MSTSHVPAFCLSTPVFPSPSLSPKSDQFSKKHPSCCAKQPPSPRSPSSVSRRAFSFSIFSLALGLNKEALTEVADSDSKVVPSQTAQIQPEQDESRQSNQNQEVNENAVQLQQTKNGIAYVDLVKGEGETPKWGNYVTFHYDLYTVDPSTKALVKQDTSYKEYKTGYLVHHGNGEALIGLEQMLHTMSVGSRRRFVLPEQLAYYKPGFIPIPSRARDRKRLSTALSEGSGIVVMDVEVLSIEDDPDDRGYYSDLTPTNEELLDIIDKVRVKEEDIEPDAIRINI